MLDIDTSVPGRIRLAGRFDAAQAEKARAVFGNVQRSCVVQFDALEYISSAGLGVLLETQKRLAASDAMLTLTGLNPLIKNVFTIAGFTAIFKID